MKTKLSIWLILSLLTAPLLAQSPFRPAPAVRPYVNQQLPAGCYDIQQPITIPRQRPDVIIPPAYNCTKSASPAGYIAGESAFSTILKFRNTIKGPLIQTEGRGATSFLGCYCASVHDLTIDGSGELRDMPWDSPAWVTERPDLHGPGALSRADGLVMEGEGHDATNLHFFQIPGTALVINPRAAPAGEINIFHSRLPSIENISVTQAINGIVSNFGDLKGRRIFLAGIAKDGLTINASGMFEFIHIWGADRSIVVTVGAMLHDIYSEAARIGIDILGVAYGTQVNGLNIGPGSCWYRGARIGANGCTIRGLCGLVQGQSAIHPDIAGVEVLPGLLHELIEGSLNIGGDGSVAILLHGGNHNQVNLHGGGWNGTVNATYIRVVCDQTKGEVLSGCTIEVDGGGDGGTVFDLSAMVDGGGNKFVENWHGTATRVIYPGGGTKYNLAPGTELWIDGVKQGP